ncbi:MAG TPA: SMP-30/gluconolactonase/LRE family protein [Polyangiaceae bacterium]|nr:SMP-30/gluconolactonase/LRE family protein [Polyangiaceae bacterium]
MLPLRCAAFVLLALALWSHDAAAWDRGAVQKFAVVPAGVGLTEGLTVDGQGNVYVTTFNVAGAGQPGQLIAFDPSGKLLRQVAIAGSSNLLLGLAFHPTTGALLVIDFGNPRVLLVDPLTGAASVFMTIPVDPTLGASPNAMNFDAQGNVYVSDSFQGIIWRTGPQGGTPVAWVNDPLLRTTGTPPFGANGLDFNHDGSALFVANTGDRRIIRIPVSGGVAGAPAIFVNSIGGPDGLFIDKSNDNLWVVANQADEIVVVDKTGRVIAKLGDFDGVDESGAPIGLLFPASNARFGDWVYVSNFSLDVRLVGIPQAVDSQWAAQLTTHTIARIRARIPPVRGLP